MLALVSDEDDGMAKARAVMDLFTDALRSRTSGEAPENQWSSAAVRHYRAAEPSRLGKDVPLYTL